MLERYRVNVAPCYSIKFADDIAYEHIFIELGVMSFNYKNMPLACFQAGALLPFRQLIQGFEFIAGAYYIGRMPMGCSSDTILIKGLSYIEIPSFFVP